MTTTSDLTTVVAEIDAVPTVQRFGVGTGAENTKIINAVPTDRRRDGATLRVGTEKMEHSQELRPSGTEVPTKLGGLGEAIFDVNVIYRETQSRGAALSSGDIAGADELVTDIGSSQLPQSTFLPLAATIAKATGLDKKILLENMLSVRAARDSMETSCATTPSTGSGFDTDPEPAAAPNPLAELLDGVSRTATIRVSCTREVADASALWIVGTWGVHPPSDPERGPDLFPRARIGSATKREGKSTLLEIYAHLVRRPLPATDISEAAQFRVIDKFRPTIVIDEADRLFRKNRDLVGIANSGFTRGGQVVRAVEVQAKGVRTFEARAYPTYTAIVYAGIGLLPSTLEDRSIRMTLQRQLRGAKRQRVSLAQLRGLRNVLGPHLMAHADAIGAAMARGVPDTAIPNSLGDRDGDNWRPLFGLAALAGGSWPDRARRAAIALCADNSDETGPEGTLARVVEAIQEKRREAVEEYLEWRRQGRQPVPGRKGIQRPSPIHYIASDALAVTLMGMDDSGFSAMRDVGTVKLALAKALRPFKIFPGQRKLSGKRVRGYDVPSIRAVWCRYRP